MNNLTELMEHIEEYNKVIGDAQRHAILCRIIKLQRKQIRLLSIYNKKLDKIKNVFIKERKEFESNFILSMQHGAAAIAVELEMLIELKRGNPAKAWDLLITAQVLTQNVIRNGLFKDQTLEGYYSRLLSYEKLVFPVMGFNSVGAIVYDSHCSICNQDYDECDHIKGKYYMGRMCCRTITSWEPEEISIVTNPADKRCRIISWTDENGDKVDALTLKILSN